MRARAFTSKLLLIVLALSANLTYSQVPQGFSYQAVVRDGNGNPIPNKSISLMVTLQSSSGTPYYTESKTLTTSTQGVINHTVGEGLPTFGTFAAVPWELGNVFIKVEIDPAGGTSYTQLGTPSKLQSVPYALFADNAKEVVSQPNAIDDDPIFVVKNKAGQIVFAVYQTGVRVYVEDSQIKGARGGFAVGGLTNQNKGQQEYFRITSDSARIYVKDKPSLKGARGGFAVGGLTNQNKNIVSRNMFFVAHDSTRIYIDDSTKSKGARGGFAVGGLTNQNKGEKANFFNISTDTSGIINPSQNRILWYPQKNAFLAGRVLIASPDSVGTNSFASGFESKAKGKYSQAMGYHSVAKGDFSTAIGKNALAGSINSFAFGEGASASKDESYAIGRGAIASGYRSFAFGSAGVADGYTTDVSKAIGDYSFAIGQGSVSSGTGSFSIGLLDSVTGDISLAIGYRNMAIGFSSVSIGYNNYAGGYNYFGNNWKFGYSATAIGYSNKATGEGSTALGYNTSAISEYATSMGKKTIAEGWVSTAMGNETTAIGMYSTSMGSMTTAYGGGSVAMGFFTNSYGSSSVAMGQETKSKPSCSLAIGQYNDTICSQSGEYSWEPTDPLFICGNGTYSARSNALTLYKNGKLVISGTLTQNSDARLKKNIRNLDNVIDKLLNLNPVYFEFNDQRTHPRGQQLGFIAQEILPLFPELVSEDGQGYLSVDYSRMSAVLLKAIKEQQKQIEELKEKTKEIESLKAELAEIKELLKK